MAENSKWGNLSHMGTLLTGIGAVLAVLMTFIAYKSDKDKPRNPDSNTTENGNGPTILRRAGTQSIEHYHLERPPQGRGNQLVISVILPNAAGLPFSRFATIHDIKKKQVRPYWLLLA